MFTIVYVWVRELIIQINDFKISHYICCTLQKIEIYGQKMSFNSSSTQNLYADLQLAHKHLRFDLDMFPKTK